METLLKDLIALLHDNNSLFFFLPSFLPLPQLPVIKLGKVHCIEIDGFIILHISRRYMSLFECLHPSPPNSDVIILMPKVVVVMGGAIWSCLDNEVGSFMNGTGAL